MLRQSATENKATRREEYVGPDGKILRRSDLSDDGEHVKLGLQLGPIEWAACEFYRLKSPRGMPVAIVHPSADPCVPRREEAPATLLAAVAGAKAALDEILVATGWSASSDPTTQMMIELARQKWAKAEAALDWWLKATEINRRAATRAATPEARRQAEHDLELQKLSAQGLRPAIEILSHVCRCGASFPTAGERDKHEDQHSR